MNEAVLIIGDWTIDRGTNAIRRGDDVRKLQPLSLDLLVYLAEHSERVVSSEELIAKFWVGRFVGDDAVHRRIANLRKNLEDDFRSPRYIQTISKRGYRLVAPVSQSGVTTGSAPRRISTRRRISMTTVMVLLVAAVLLAALQIQRVMERRSALSAAIESAATLVAGDKFQAAWLELAPYLLEQNVEVDALAEKILLPVSMYTLPADLPVEYRFASVEDDWKPLGVTPITNLNLPRGHYKLRIGADVFMDATNPGVTLNSAGRAKRVIELPTEQTPDGMVFIPGGEYRLGAWGFVEEFDLGGFFIDRLEVSNRDYQEFVVAGGYENPAFWQDLVDASNGALSWEIIRGQFVDVTGRPGPSHWELGRYPPGEAALPVVGISWYEASAYLKFRDKSLPGAHHWLRAALGPMEWKFPFASDLVPRSNLGATKLLPVDRPCEAEVNGSCDMIGNAAEWTTLDSKGSKAVIGSSFRDPAWAYNFPSPQDPMRRLDNTGLRGMRASSSTTMSPLPEFPLFNDFIGSIRKVSDEMFAGMKLSFDYAAGTLDSGNVAIVSEEVSENWIRREILIPTARPDDPMPVFLFIPRNYPPPYQSAIYLPPADSWSPGFRSESVVIENYQVDFVPRSGRVLIWPVYSGSHERYDNYHSDSGPERASLGLERNRRVRDEVGRIIDYLEREAEFDGNKVALMALSYGATLAPFVLATEPRIGAAIIYSAGIAPPIPIFANPQNDPNVFWSRVQQPTLLMNGRYDPIRPHEFVARPLIDLLATPPDAKKLILYDSGHWPLPRYLMMRDSLDWLDQYLGHPAPQILKQ